jgi:hypothetical protein
VRFFRGPAISFFLHAAIIAWAVFLIAVASYRLAMVHAPAPDPASKYVRIYDVRDLADRWVALRIKLVWVDDKLTVAPLFLSEAGPPPQHLRAATREEVVRDIANFIEDAVHTEEGGYDGPEIVGQTGSRLIVFDSPAMQENVENALRELRLSDSNYPVRTAGH